MRVSIEWLKEFVPFDLSPKELAKDLARIGTGVKEIEKWGEDWILELEITPNRPDLLSILGVAREVSALMGTPLRLSDPKVKEGENSVHDLAKVTVEDNVDCSRYASRIITGLEVKPSPSWMQDRLEKSGIRSINNIVDATNYTLLERGHPLHAFDFEKLANQSIHIRRAKKGELLITLDGAEKRLDPSILLVCDGNGPVALAGIMGGTRTEISEKTTRILIESAFFDPGVIRRGAKTLGLSTEASYRFERRANMEDVLPSLNRAATLMSEVAGGILAKGVIDHYPHPSLQKTLPLRMNRIQEILGVPIEEEEVRKILLGLGFGIETHSESPITNHPSPLTINVPYFRRDCHREIDLIEEVARMHGYEALPSLFAKGGSFVGRPDEREREIKEIEKILLGSGLTQVSTIPLQSPEDTLKSSGSENPPQALRLRNPLSRDYTLLQTSLLSGILRILQKNQWAGQKQLGIFEIGKVFLKNDFGLKETLSLLIARSEESGEAIGFSLVKGLLESLLKKFKLKGLEWHPLKNDLFTSQSTIIRFREEPIGRVGVLKEKTREKFLLKGEVAIGELDLEGVLEKIPKETIYIPLPKYPPIDRDLSCIVTEKIPAGDLVRLLRKGGENILEEVRFIGHYQGDPIPMGKKSLTYTLRFRSRERTLTDREVDVKMEKIVGLLEKELKGEIR